MIGTDHSRPPGRSQGFDVGEHNMNKDFDSNTKENAESLARSLWRCFDEARFQDALPLLADDFEAVWPNTRERIRGPENFVALNEAYPGSWRCKVERVEPVPEGVVTVTRISDETAEVFAVSFFTIRGDRIIRAVEYFGDGIDPPFERTRWCERYEEPAGLALSK
jgi:hypothetical protein